MIESLDSIVKSAISRAPDEQLLAIGLALGVEIDRTLLVGPDQQASAVRTILEGEVDARAAEFRIDLPENPTHDDLVRCLGAGKSLLTTVEAILTAANSGRLASAEQQLRVENRIHDDPKILAQLGYHGEIPEIPAELIEECVRTGGTVVLKFKTTVTDIQANLNAALKTDQRTLPLFVGSLAVGLATTNEEPEWIIVPNTVEVDTLSHPKAEALALFPGSATCDPMETVLLLGYNDLLVGEQMPGFKNQGTFTNLEDVVVGSSEQGISVGVFHDCDQDGHILVGLAPRLASKAKE